VLGPARWPEQPQALVQAWSGVAVRLCRENRSGDIG